MIKKVIFGLAFLSLALASCAGQITQTAPEPALTTLAESQTNIISTLTVTAPTAPTAPAAVVPATEAPAAGDVSFTNDVKPILSGSCKDCHGGNQTKARLNMTTYEGLMAGGLDGVVIVAGNSTDSYLIQLVTDGKMPKRGSRLTSEQIQTISRWIDAGALNN